MPQSMLIALLLVSLATALAIPPTCFDNFGSCMDACPAPESGARCDTELNVPGLGGQPGYCCHEPEYGCFSEQGYALANCASKDVTKYDDFFYCCEPRVRATGKTVEIAPGVLMPSINLGTCCGSDPKVGIPAWLAAGGSGIDTSNDYASTTDIAGVLASTPRSAFFMTSKVHVPCPGGCSPDYALEQVRWAPMASDGLRYPLSADEYLRLLLIALVRARAGAAGDPHARCRAA
jgi:hypothetical protein